MKEKNTTDSVLLIHNRNQKPEGKRKQESLGHHLEMQQSEALYS